MSEKDPVVKEEIKYAGILSFGSFYEYLAKWLKENEFNFQEDSYSEKIKDGGKDLEIKWSSNREITDYYRINMDIAMRVLGMKDVEVEIDGKRKKMNKVVDLSLKIKGVLERDYKNNWEVSAISKFFRDLYDKFIVNTRTKKMHEMVNELVVDFKEEAKAFLELTGKRN